MKWYNDYEQTIPKNEWPVNTNNRLKELIYIKKPKTKKEEWQLIWKYCPNVIDWLMYANDLCPPNEKKDCTKECKDCWHDAIWGGDE